MAIRPIVLPETDDPALNPPCARRCGDCCACLSPLPRGETCAGCAHVARCDAFGFHGGTREQGGSREAGYCAFVPSRWLPRPRPAAEPAS